jgi:hypothetical protein
MTLVLSHDESDVLERMLRDYLPELKREIARTDAHDFRHLLVRRQELCETLLDRLQHGAPARAR